MLNIVALMGRVTQDIELKKTGNNIGVCSFTLAVQRNFVKSGEEAQTDFIKIVAWRHTAEFAARYFKKGSLMALDGEINTTQYTDKEGNNRTSFEVLANHIHFTGERTDSKPQDSVFEPSKDVMSFSTGSDDDFQDIEDSEDLPF